MQDVLNPKKDFVFPSPMERKVKIKDILEEKSKIPANMYMNDRPFIFRDNITIYD